MGTCEKKADDITKQMRVGGSYPCEFQRDKFVIPAAETGSKLKPLS